jgi:hypothetical protein
MTEHDQPQAVQPNAKSRKPRRGVLDLCRDESGMTTMDHVLLLGAIVLPCSLIFAMCLGAIVDYYRMMTMLNSLPLP